ncbi:MAG: DUF4162 domain-containing protein, partial [Bacteroidota bacterium]
MSTHRMESVETLCDRVTMIHQARKVLDGTIEDVKNAFKKNKFEIEYKGSFQDQGNMFNVISHEKASEGYDRMVITLKSDLKSSELIQDLARDVEIRLFKEILPSMKDIFLEKVKA